jgi:hypothetical protein
MKRLLRAVVSVVVKRGRNTPRSRLDWRGRPREEAPAHDPSGCASLPSARSIYDTLVLPAALKPAAQAHDGPNAASGRGGR